MKILLTADLHLSDSIFDEYRWRVFEQIRTVAKEEKVGLVCIVGDLVDKKDVHRSAFVNRVVNELTSISHNTGAEVVVVRGNHDYIEQAEPFFHFIRHIPNLYYITMPTLLNSYVRDIGLSILAFPHSRTPDHMFTSCKAAMDKAAEGPCIMLMHQTFTGANSESGVALSGTPTKYFRGYSDSALFFSGDIHEAQKVGPIQYIGAPYPINYGDEYETRLLLCTPRKNKKAKVQKVKVHNIQKIACDIEDEEDLEALTERVRKNDQVKVRLRITHRNLATWMEIRNKVHSRLMNECGASVVKVNILSQVAGDGSPRPLDEENVGKPAATVTVLEKYAKQKGIKGKLLTTGKSVVRDDD